MASNFGKTIQVSTFGASHGYAIGGIVEGLPCGHTIDIDELQAFLKPVSYTHLDVYKRQTSNIANTTAGIDPIFKKFFIEEKKGSFTPKTAPDLNDKTFWLYKEAHTIDQQWSIKACGVRQRHIDQAQSFNLYITPQMKAKEILDLYVEAYKQGICLLYTSRCV